jgi:MoxR-like ATPase
MEEGQVTVDGETRDLPEPFFVIATQNPVDQEGTFPLPEAQVDRFVVKTKIGYPDLNGEIGLLRRRAGRSAQSPSVEPVLDRESVLAIREAPESVRVDDDLLTYMAELTHATRQDRRVAVGVSPRGTQRLFETARAQAVLEAREFVTPDHIKTVAQSVLAHRLVLTPDAQVNDVQKRDVVDDVLGQVDVPTVE